MQLGWKATVSIFFKPVVIIKTLADLTNRFANTFLLLGKRKIHVYASKNKILIFLLTTIRPHSAQFSLTAD